jgi:hypothetical protein
MPGLRWGRVLRLAVLVGVMGTGLLLMPAAADASTNLSTVVLSSTLPGLVPTQPGATNGPLVRSGLDDLPGVSHFLQLLSENGASAFRRTWTAQPPNGEAVVIFAFELPTRDDTGPFLVGLDKGIAADGTSRFSADVLPGASGYGSETTTAGTSVAEWVVTFAKGNFVFAVEVASAGGVLPDSDALSLAVKQAAVVPGALGPASASGGKPGSYVAGEIVGAVIIVLLAVLVPVALVQRSRRRKEAAAVTPAASPVGVNPSPVSPVAVPGWHPLGGDPHDLGYWDGQAWTARRLWQDGAWEQVPFA